MIRGLFDPGISTQTHDTPAAKYIGDQCAGQASASPIARTFMTCKSGELSITTAKTKAQSVRQVLWRSFESGPPRRHYRRARTVRRRTHECVCKRACVYDAAACIHALRQVPPCLQPVRMKCRANRSRRPLKRPVYVRANATTIQFDQRVSMGLSAQRGQKY